ncbi:MAG: AbrB/MazE/SpoVT family DNA-binding domain-containing protein [Candidatus Heimdallarchaeota archaeon]
MTEFIEGKYIYGTVKVGERGQVVIPSTARDHFNIKPGDLLLVVGDRKIGGLGLIKADAMKELVMKVLKGLGEVE